MQGTEQTDDENNKEDLDGSNQEAEMSRRPTDADVDASTEAKLSDLSNMEKSADEECDPDWASMEETEDHSADDEEIDDKAASNVR